LKTLERLLSFHLFDDFERFPVEFHRFYKVVLRAKCNRYTLSLPVIIQTAKQQSFSARSKDVSSGGAYLVLESDANLMSETELYLTVSLSEIGGEDEVLVRAHGKAVRVDKFGEGGTGSVGVAVVFETHEFIRSVSPLR
jgi:c-di-GMP-binding flagellar brake protein YcgR